MARPKKETAIYDGEKAEYRVVRGSYNITKPHEQYVVRLGDDVVYACATEDGAHVYLDLVKAPPSQ